MMPNNGIYRVADYGQLDFSEIEATDIENLQSIANFTIGELCKKNANLLVFPDEGNKSYKDGIEKEPIFSMDDNLLKAGDIMGFVGKGNSQLTIYSRFSKDDEEDYFLHYMVSKVFNINLFDLKHSSSHEKVFDFLVYMFPFYLNKALKQGMIKQYQTRQKNDSRICGTIDVSRHIKLNSPYLGNIAYNEKLYSVDNNTTQLIRHTIEYIKSSYMSNILSSDSLVRENVSQICYATEMTYKEQDRNRIIAKNIKPLVHPFFTAYNVLQKICVQILTHKQQKYGKDDNKIHGLLFSGSWLWEEFLYKTVLADCKFKHPQNKEGKGSIYLFEEKEKDEICSSRYKRYPDYYKDDFILDAKYKRLENNKIDRNDIHQVVSYMYVEKSEKGGFIYPNKEITKPKDTKIGTLRGYGGSIYNIGVPIPQQSVSYKDFDSKMQSVHEQLKTAISDIENDI